VQKLDKRISEAKKLGYQVFVTSNFKKDLAEIKGIEILGLDKIGSLITKLFE
jgi:predicted ATP-dependent serine protease